YGRTNFNQMSRFIKEIPIDLIEVVEEDQQVREVHLEVRRKNIIDRSQMNLILKNNQNKERCDHKQLEQKQNHGKQAIKQIIKYGELELSLAFKVKVNQWN